MQTSNANQDFGSDDSVWVLLAESLLRDFLSDYVRREEPVAGSLFRTVQELGMSRECMQTIAGTLIEFAKEGSPEFSGRIRIFCQKKILDDARSAKTSEPYYAEQSKKQKQILPDFGQNTIDEWGYFMIERGEGPPHHSIDLYLYKEGD